MNGTKDVKKEVLSMVHAMQKFGKYSRVNTRLNAWAHWYIFFVGRILLFLMGRWALSSHSFLGEQPCEFCFCPLLWWCRGFCSCLVIHFFVTNCLLFVLPFHNLLSLCNFSFCVLFLSSLFLPTCPVPPRSPELCCFVLSGGCLWLCLSSESTAPANCTLPTRCRSLHRNT